MRPEAFFLPMTQPDRGQRFCLFYPPLGPVTLGAVVYVHPFADEMNKSRRMAALQARALCEAGYAVLQIDLLGCGDSSGDFGDASWQDWVADVVEASRWLQARTDAPLWLWGLRCGCLVAVEAARELAHPCHFLFWQAPGNGRGLLQQFLRVKAAANLMEGEGRSKGVMDSLRQQLAAGSAVDVAGYSLSPGLAAGLDAATLQPPTQCGGARIEWLELSAGASASPASERALALWRDARFAVATRIVSGPAFWKTSEIEEVPALVEASVAALAAPARAERVAA
jgi:uncharacterized protein